MTKLKWATPTPMVGLGHQRLDIDTECVASTLRSRRGDWAQIAHEWSSRNAAKVYAAKVRRGDVVAFRPSGEFQAVARGLNVYVRYVGPTR